ncbi:MAG: DUF5034 domain-containing protein [Lentimicrobium sp.]|jgi:hypothetical protein|nr:DUF5034 domain-containing protein [Lentimicrobium sp.]MDD2528663.1 hypothetical protein [Lentimicrobiaceae bacterium]MDD4596770.1 hypothetical protein [Lentimicrobiaceae bacterium]HAH56508.1 hypothetical protein [Bacteroidales bacterium]
MHLIKKMLFIALLFNVIQIIPACGDCDVLPTYFDFTTLEIQNLDNSGEWVMPATADSMHPAAIAFELTIFDSLRYYRHFTKTEVIYTVGYKSSFALSDDCSQPLIANHYLTAIQITTLYDVNDDIHAGDDVTDFFVGQLRSNTSPVSGVYVWLDAIIAQTENKIYYDSGVEAFGIYLKPEVEMPIAQFEITLTFSDGSILSDTTSLIHIIN